jgi:hypothetical protein
LPTTVFILILGHPFNRIPSSSKQYYAFFMAFTLRSILLDFLSLLFIKVLQIYRIKIKTNSGDFGLLRGLKYIRTCRYKNKYDNFNSAFGET